MQKFMKVVVAFLLVFSLGLPSATTNPLAAEQWTAYPSNTTGDTHKSWKVTFSDVVNSSTVSSQNVYVKKKNGEPVDVTATVTGATITVTPKAPYTIGETYTLYLHSSIQSVNEKALPNTTFQFTILSALEIAISVALEAKNTAEAIKTGQPVFANPFAGTKDELARANAFVVDLEKAIRAAHEKVEAAQALINTAKATGVTVTELAGANTNINAAKKAIADAEKSVVTAKQAIDTASITAQLAVTAVTVQTSSKVDVTLATAPAYELTKADADKFRVTMDGTVLAVTDVVKSQTDNKSYTLSIGTASLPYPLSGKQGVLSVNNTKAVIPNSEFGYDFKAPTLVKVDVLDSRHVKVAFSENMRESEAASYQIYKASTPNSLNTFTNAVLSADKKSVTLSLNEDSALVEGNYILKVTAPVLDAAGNSLDENTTVNFPVAKNQLADKTSPSLTAADYNVRTGLLNVTFDEEVKILNIESFSLGGERLSSNSTSIATNDGTKHQIKVDNKSAVDKILTNPLRLTIASGAVEDIAANRNLLTSYDLTVAIPPNAKEASYSEYTKLLRVTFDQVIDMTNVDTKKFTVTVNGKSHPLTGGTVQVTKSFPIVDIELTKEDSQAIEKLAGESETGKLTIAAGAVANTENPSVMNLGPTDIRFTYIKDTGKPRVEKVTVTTVENRNNDMIDIEFTNPMEESSAKNLANYVFTHGDPSKSIPLTSENATVQITADLKKVTIKLKGIDLQTNTDYSLQVSNIMDSTGKRLDPELRTGKIVGDLITPTIKSVTGSASDTEDIVVVYFTEAVTKESAENLDNYKINSPAAKPIQRTGLPPTLTYSETETEFKVEIRYAKPAPTLILESGGKVKVTAKDIVDLAGNQMTEHNQSGDVLDKVAPTITKVQGRTVQSDLDEIVVTFSENVNKAMAENPSNYKLEVAGANVPLDKLKAGEDVKYDSTDLKTIFYLDTSDKVNGHDAGDYALKNGQALAVTVMNIEDEEGNIIVAPNNIGKGSVEGYIEGNTPKDNDKVPTKIVQESIKVKNAHTIQLGWDEEVDEAKLLASDFVLNKDGSPYQITAVKLDETKKLVELTVGESITFNETKLKLSTKGNPNLTDLAGNIVESFNGLAVKELGTTEMYSLKGASEKVAPSKFISIGDNQQISDLFKLTAGVTSNGEGFIVDTVSFNVTTTAPVLNKLQLMWSTDNIVGNDVAVSMPKTNIAGSSLTFEGINKEIASGKSGYFYILGDVSRLGTVTIELSDAAATSAQTNFKIESPSFKKVPGTEIVIDISEPKLEFLKSESNKKLEVRVVDDSPLAYSPTKGQLNSTANYKDSFEVVDAVGTKVNSTVIQSVYYESEQQTIMITTSNGLPTNQFIRLKAGEFTDLAGNAVATTLVAQGNGINEVFVNPLELMNPDAYEGNFVQNATGTGPITYGPSSGMKVMNGTDKTVTVTGNASGIITLNNVDIKGNLLIDTPNASVIIGNNVKVGGTVTVRNVSSAGVVNNGEINHITIEKSNIRFINNKETENLTVQASQVKLGGTGLVPVVNVEIPATVELENNAKVTNLKVNSNSTIKIGVGAVVNDLKVAGNSTVNIINSGTVEKINGDGIAFVEGKDPVVYETPIHQKTALEAIKLANNADTLEEVLNKYKSSTALNLNLEGYKQFDIKYQKEIHKLVYNSRNDYKNVIDVQTVFNNAVIDQKQQFEVDEVARNITNTLNVTTNGKPTFPVLPSADYEISIADPINSTIYDQNGVGQKVGTATVKYTVMHKTTKKTAKTGNVTVTVAASDTGIVANFEVIQQGANAKLAVAPSPVQLAGLTFTAPPGEELNGYKFVLGAVKDGTTPTATVDTNTKIVTISGDFSKDDGEANYSTASEIQKVIQSEAGLSGVNVSGTAVAADTGMESAPFSNGTAQQNAEHEIFTITVKAKDGIASASGKVKFTVGGIGYEIVVTENMTVEEIANTLNSLLFNVPDYDTSVSANVVTLTARNAGDMQDLTGSILNQ